MTRSPAHCALIMPLILDLRRMHADLRTAGADAGNPLHLRTALRKEPESGSLARRTLSSDAVMGTQGDGTARVSVFPPCIGTQTATIIATSPYRLGVSRDEAQKGLGQRVVTSKILFACFKQYLPIAILGRVTQSAHGRYSVLDLNVNRSLRRRVGRPVDGRSTSITRRGLIFRTSSTTNIVQAY